VVINGNLKHLQEPYNCTRLCLNVCSSEIIFGEGMKYGIVSMADFPYPDIWHAGNRSYLASCHITYIGIKRNVAEDWKKFKMRNFIICTLYQILLEC
jgi:hypothetical protein